MNNRAHETWITTIRDPAEARTEGERRLTHGRAIAAYEIAQLDSGWVWKSYTDVASSHRGRPWSRRPVLSRDQALHDVLGFLTHELKKIAEMPKTQYSSPEDAAVLLRSLIGDLFGFLEPPVRVSPRTHRHETAVAVR